MALLATISTSLLSSGAVRLSTRAVGAGVKGCCLRQRSEFCRGGVRGFGDSSVFGRRLVGSVVGFALWSSGSTTSRAEGMETSASSDVKSASSIYDFVVKSIDGSDVDLSQYRGKVLLIVNVASMCGLTNTNYKELADIYNKFKDQGFEILAFPCNQFGGQEPGSNEQIKEFACTRFKAEYPIFDKINVNGSQEAPLYKYLKSQKGGGLLGNSIKWNFAKFLVDKNGKVVDRYAPTTAPSKIEKDIKNYLS